MRYMKEILKKNRNWVLVYLASVFDLLYQFPGSKSLVFRIVHPADFPQCQQFEIQVDFVNWVLVYLALGLASAFLANYKADYFQKIVDGLTDRTITFHGILL